MDARQQRGRWTNDRSAVSTIRSFNIHGPAGTAGSPPGFVKGPRRGHHYRQRRKAVRELNRDFFAPRDLDTIIDSDPSVPDYVLEMPARYLQCGADILERTLVDLQ